MCANLLLLLATLLAVVNTSPTVRTNPITAADIVKVDPNTSSCAGAPFPDECRTAYQAAPFIADSFTWFGITTFGEQAAVLATMLYESGDFKYAINHFPGIPGQGTRNMQSPAYNLKYAEDLATTCTMCGITSSQVEVAESDSPTAVLALVNTDRWGFGSAAWFLATQCDQSVREALAEGADAGWTAYLECIGTSSSDDRDALWNAAIALGAW